MDITNIIAKNAMANIAQTTNINIPKFKQIKSTTGINNKVMNIGSIAKLSSDVIVNDTIKSVVTKPQITRSNLPIESNSINWGKVIGWTVIIVTGTYIAIKAYDYFTAKPSHISNTKEEKPEAN